MEILYLLSYLLLNTNGEQTSCVDYGGAIFVDFLALATHQCQSTYVHFNESEEPTDIHYDVSCEEEGGVFNFYHDDACSEFYHQQVRSSEESSEESEDIDTNWNCENNPNDNHDCNPVEFILRLYESNNCTGILKFEVHVQLAPINNHCFVAGKEENEYGEIEIVAYKTNFMFNDSPAELKVMRYYDEMCEGNYDPVFFVPFLNDTCANIEWTDVGFSSVYTFMKGDEPPERPPTQRPTEKPTERPTEIPTGITTTFVPTEQSNNGGYSWDLYINKVSLLFKSSAMKHELTSLIISCLLVILFIGVY